MHTYVHMPIGLSIYQQSLRASTLHRAVEAWPYLELFLTSVCNYDPEDNKCGTHGLTFASFASDAVIQDLAAADRVLALCSRHAKCRQMRQQLTRGA